MSNTSLCVPLWITFHAPNPDRAGEYRFGDFAGFAGVSIPQSERTLV